MTHYSHPKTLGAMIAQLDRAGAKRIRLVESCWATAGPLEEYMLDSGWNVRSLQSAATRAKVEFENTNARRSGKEIRSGEAAGAAYIFPAYELNRAYVDTDLFMSMAKLKNHATCGITLSMKNCFGNTPASIYGDDAGVDEPNEAPTQRPRQRLPLREAPTRESGAAGDRPQVIPRAGISHASHHGRACAGRPIDIAFIDGVETVSGGEGPWIRGLRYIRPGVLLMGTNGVTTDAVATAVMGYDPQADKGTAPFRDCDNTLKLAEALGVGTRGSEEDRSSRAADSSKPGFRLRANRPSLSRRLSADWRLDGTTAAIISFGNTELSAERAERLQIDRADDIHDRQFLLLGGDDREPAKVLCLC